MSSATGESHFQNPRRTKDPLVSALPQLREGLCQGAGTACSQQTPESAQPGRRVGGETAGRSRRSSRAGGDHKWRSVVKHGGEHRLTLTFTAPPRKSTARQTLTALKHVRISLDQSRNLIPMHVCSLLANTARF